MNTASTLRISITIIRDIVTLYLNGRFCFRAYKEFKAAYTGHLANSAVGCIVINLAGVHSLDSSSMGMLLELRECAIKKNKLLVLSNPSDNAARKLEYANFDKIFAMQ